MENVKIGHFSDQENGTGVSVFLFEQAAVGGYWVCGSAPATHELVVLDPENSVPEVYGLVLAGGSAYGLFAAEGVMTYLTERRIGHLTPHGVVPIVPAAAIYDLDVKNAVAPRAADAYEACLTATENDTQSGKIGAGTGATVGKLIPDANLMEGGLGRAELQLDNGVQVLAYAIVNAVGDVRDMTGRIVAGAKNKQGQFADCEQYLLSGRIENNLFMLSNTTLAVVFTNAKFSKEELKRIAKMATAGIARAVVPAFTQFDGDLIFCMSVGNKHASEMMIGTIAAHAVRLAILDAVKGSV